MVPQKELPWETRLGMASAYQANRWVLMWALKMASK